MDSRDYGILENFAELGIGIIEFAIDDYCTTLKGLTTCYKKLAKTFDPDFKAKHYHERQGDICLSIFHKMQNLNDIEEFLTGEWVKKLTDMDVDALFRETKKKLRKKGYKVNLMGLTVQSDARGVTVYANEKSYGEKSFKLYSIGIASKNMNGGWNNGYINCRFKKGIDVANKTKIKINSAFFVVNDSNGKKYTQLMITDFDVIKDDADVEEFMKIPEGVDEDAPFL